MPTQKYALEAGGEKRLELNWKGVYKNLTIKLDGVKIGTIPDDIALKQGQDFQLPDGSSLFVGREGMRLLITCNGKHLAGSPASPESKLARANHIVYLEGGTEIFFGAFLLASIGFRIIYIGIGIALLGLGYMVSKRITLALYIAINICMLLTMFSIIVGLLGTASSGAFFFFIVIRLIFLLTMYQGIGAINELNRSSDF